MQLTPKFLALLVALPALASAIAVPAPAPSSNAPTKVIKCYKSGCHTTYPASGTAGAKQAKREARMRNVGGKRDLLYQDILEKREARLPIPTKTLKRDEIELIEKREARHGGRGRKNNKRDEIELIERREARFFPKKGLKRSEIESIEKREASHREGGRESPWKGHKRDEIELIEKREAKHTSAFNPKSTTKKGGKRDLVDQGILEKREARVFWPKSREGRHGRKRDEIELIEKREAKHTSAFIPKSTTKKGGKRDEAGLDMLV